MPSVVKCCIMNLHHSSVVLATNLASFLPLRCGGLGTFYYVRDVRGGHAYESPPTFEARNRGNIKPARACTKGLSNPFCQLVSLLQFPVVIIRHFNTLAMVESGHSQT